MKEYKFVKDFNEGVKRTNREMDEANLSSSTFKKEDSMTAATIKNYLFKEDILIDVPTKENDEDLIIKTMKKTLECK